MAIFFYVGKASKEKLVFKESLRRETDEDKRILVGSSFQSLGQHLKRLYRPYAELEKEGK